MKTKIGFSIYIHGELTREVTFDRPIINVGKLSTSNLRLDDVNVSRAHAVVEQREDGRWRVTDLGSTNGTLLRGERVVQSDLHDGDRLVLGVTTLLVHLDDAPPPKVEGRAAPRLTSSEVDEIDEVDAVAGTAVPAPALSGLGEDGFHEVRAATATAHPDALEVALLWGETVLAVESFDRPQAIPIGEARGCRFALPQTVLGGMSYDLVVAQGDRFVLDLSNANLQGDLLIDGAVWSVDELRADGGRVTLDRQTRARLRAGQFTLLVSYGLAPRRAGVGGLGRVDLDAWIYTSLSAVVHIAFLVALTLLPTDLAYRERDPRELTQRAIDVLRVEVKPAAEAEKRRDVDDLLDRRAPSEADAHRDSAEDELRVDRAPIEVARPEPTPSPLVDRLAMKERERERFAALPEAERKQQAEQLVNQTATHETLQNTALDDLLRTDPDLNDRAPRLRTIGSRSDDPNAVGDFARGAVDPFGGSLPSGPGDLGAVGDPNGPDGPNGPNGPPGPAVTGVLDGKHRTRDVPEFSMQPPREPIIISTTPKFRGELDPATVQRYIRGYLSGIKACYQERLQSNHGLGGKLTLTFTIMPSGDVLDAACANSTLGDEALHACINTKVSRWTFPNPKDGGLVEVQYPIILKAR